MTYDKNGRGQYWIKGRGTEQQNGNIYNRDVESVKMFWDC